MLREKRRHTNYKPNRRLDAKSSRGMIYENEELRLRTININAEVERGQSDIRKLKKENDQLRREIWTLRDEYDKLEKILIKSGVENATNAGENANRLNLYKNYPDDDESHLEDDDDCEDDDGDNNYSEEDDDSYNSHSNESCISCLNEEKQLEEKLKISKSASPICNTNSKHHLHFDHLSIVSEENLTTGDVANNNNSSQNSFNSSNTKLNNDTLYRSNYDFNNSLNDIQSIVPSLQHFENLPYDTLGPSVDTQGQIKKTNHIVNKQETLDHPAAESADSVSGRTSPTRNKPKHFFSPIKAKRVEKPAAPSVPPAYKMPPSASQYPYQQQKGYDENVYADYNYKATGPDICVNNVLACDLSYLPMPHALTPIPMPLTEMESYYDKDYKGVLIPTANAVGAATTPPPPPNSPGGHFRNGGNLEELLFDIEVLSFGLQNISLPNELVDPAAQTVNQAATKPYKSEINLFLTYPDDPTNLNSNGGPASAYISSEVNASVAVIANEKPLIISNNAIVNTNILSSASPMMKLTESPLMAKKLPPSPLSKRAASTTTLPALVLTPSVPQTNSPLLVPPTQFSAIPDISHSEDNNCISNNLVKDNISENNSINNNDNEINNNNSNNYLNSTSNNTTNVKPSKISLPATIKRRLFAKKSVSTSVVQQQQNKDKNKDKDKDKDTEPILASNSTSNLTSSLQPIATKDELGSAQKSKRRVSIYFNGKKQSHDKEKKQAAAAVGSGSVAGSGTVGGGGVEGGVSTNSEGITTSSSLPSTPMINIVETINGPTTGIPASTLNRRLSLDNIGINSASLSPFNGKLSDTGTPRNSGRRHSTSHHHHHSHGPHRKLSIDSSKMNSNSGIGIPPGGLLSNNALMNNMSRCNSGKSLISMKKRSRSDSIYHDHHGDSTGCGGNTSYSERNSNSFASSRESSTSLSIKSHKSRRISITSHSATGKIPWCGCWGNGCI